MTKRTQYSKEFKHEAIRLSQQPGVGMARAAHDLGIRKSGLHRWLKDAEQQGKLAFPGTGRQVRTPEQEKLKRLRREVEILREEREILQKATAFFAKESR
jgi:transposase